jgi:ABC-type transport system involved in multi-copper enzyme maturation permease subunit
MKAIVHVAVNVFKESVRDKVLYSIVAFAVLLISASYLIGELSAGQDIKIIKDLGLAAISIFGLLIAIFIGIGLVWKEVEKRSIYSIVSKPVKRGEFVLGKYCGLVLTLFINVAVMTAAYYAVLAFMNRTSQPSALLAAQAPPADPAMLKAIGLILVELMLVTAIALFFSTFSSPFLSAIFTAGLWVAGHFNDDLRNFGALIDAPLVARVTHVLYYVIPNFAAFDVKNQVVHAHAVPLNYVAVTSIYGLAYVALLLAGAVTVFSRRDFK